MSSFNKLLTLHRYGLFERSRYEKLVDEKSHIIIPFGKLSSTKYKRTITNVDGYIFYIYSQTNGLDTSNKYTLNNILSFLHNNKELFIEFIQQMNIYFNEKHILHNNYFSMYEINDILIRIYINEITNLENITTSLTPTIEVLLDMVETAASQKIVSKTNDNPFSEFIFCERPQENSTMSPQVKSVPPQSIEPIRLQPIINIQPQTLPESRINNQLRNNQLRNNIKYKKKSIPLVLKRKLWDKYFGEQNGVAQCPCCKLSQISTFSFHCGHIISEKNGGLLVLDNLIPLCQSCNSSMGMRSYTEFCKDIGISNNIR